MPAYNLMRFKVTPDEPGRRSQPELDATNTLLELGEKYLLSGQYVVAERTFRTVLHRMAARSTRPIDFAIVLKALSSAVKLKGDWAEAEKLNRQATQVCDDQRALLEAAFLKPSAVPRVDFRRRVLQSHSIQGILRVTLWILAIAAYLMMAMVLLSCAPAPGSHDTYMGCGRGGIFYGRR